MSTWGSPFSQIIGGPDGLLLFIFTVCLLTLLYEWFATMSNIYTLDDIRNDLDKQFAPVVIDGVTLRPLLRLGRKDREKVMAAFQVTQKADTSTPEGLEEMITNLQTIISVVAGDRGPELVEKIGDDVALLVKITELWAEATQPGEASKSPS